MRAVPTHRLAVDVAKDRDGGQQAGALSSTLAPVGVGLVSPGGHNRTVSPRGGGARAAAQTRGPGPFAS